MYHAKVDQSQKDDFMIKVSNYVKVNESRNCILDRPSVSIIVIGCISDRRQSPVERSHCTPLQCTLLFHTLPHCFTTLCNVLCSSTLCNVPMCEMYCTASYLEEKSSRKSIDLLQLASQPDGNQYGLQCVQT